MTNGEFSPLRRAILDVVDRHGGTYTTDIGTGRARIALAEEVHAEPDCPTDNLASIKVTISQMFQEGVLDYFDIHTIKRVGSTPVEDGTDVADDEDDELGASYRAQREDRGLSRRQVSEATGITESKLFRIETTGVFKGDERVYLDALYGETTVEAEEAQEPTEDDMDTTVPLDGGAADAAPAEISRDPAALRVLADHLLAEVIKRATAAAPEPTQASLDVIDELKAQVAQLSDERTTLTARLDEYHANAERLQGNVTAAERRARVAEREQAEAEQERDRAQQRHGQANAEIGRLNAQLQNVQRAYGRINDLPTVAELIDEDALRDLDILMKQLPEGR